MKKIIYKLLYICLFTLTLLILKSTNVQAATTSLTANTTEPTEGQTVTVTASVTAGAWNLQFEGDGKAETIYGYTQSNANASDSKSITFTAGSAGTKYTFTLKGDMTDINASNSEQVDKSITITVQAPAVTIPEQPTVPTPEPTKSTEARLSNLGIQPNDFTNFKRDTKEYSVTVPNSV